MKGVEKTMGNRYQKLLYQLSALSPVLGTGSYVWCLEQGDFRLFYVCLVLILALNLCFWKSFSVMKKSLPTRNIRVSDLQHKGSWAISYILSYLVPLANLVFSTVNLRMYVLLSLLILLALQFLPLAIANPMLSIVGYRFYSVSTEPGNPGFMLISRRTLREKHEIHTVVQIFDNLLLDTEG